MIKISGIDRCASFHVTCYPRPGFTKPKLRSNQNVQVRASPTDNQSDILDLWLPTRAVAENVNLGVVPDGKGQAILITDVNPGSVPDKAGIQIGHKLVGVSDPAKDTVVWPLGLNPSLKFVKQLLQVRRMGQVQLQLQLREDLLQAPPPPATAADAPRPLAAAQGARGAGSSAAQASIGTLDSMLSDAESDAEGDEDRPAAPPPSPQVPQAAAPSGGAAGGGKMTVGDMMSSKYKQAQQKGEPALLSGTQQRKQKRAAYMGEVNKRNDGPLLLGLVAAFVGPAVIILGIAASSGYLDNLYQGSMTIR